MYHVITDPRPDAAYPDLFVSAADFAGQMRWLDRHGYHPVTLRAVWDHWHRGTPLPKRPIVVSFDDGYRSVAHAALPPMRARGWPGVLNLTVKNLRVSGGLSERQVRRLIGAGWEIDSHTVTHPDLPSLGDRELARELTESRRQLRRLFRVPVDFFCYPGGRYDARVERGRAPRRLPRRDDDPRGARHAGRAVRAPARPREPERRRRRPREGSSTPTPSS